jgi:hypothetical protein
VLNIVVWQRALGAARTVDPAVDPAAVHAAVESALVAELLTVAAWPADRVRAHARDLIAGHGQEDGRQAA